MQVSSMMPPISGNSSQIICPDWPKRLNACVGPKQVSRCPWSWAICCPFVNDSGIGVPSSSASLGL